MSATPDEKTAGDLHVIAIWAVLVLAFTLAGALPFNFVGHGLEEVNHSGSPPAPLLAGILLTGYAPTISALLVCLVVPRSGGLCAFLREFGEGRAGAGWYALALFAPMAIVLAADGIYVLSGGPAPTAWFAIPQTFPSAAFWGPLVAGCLGEEPAWRGFALPRLSTRLGALWTSILIGVLWGTWHLWPAITPGGVSQLAAANLLQTYIRMISTSILYAWLYNNTQGSLALAMVAHGGHNLAIDFIPMPEHDAGVVPLIIALLYLAAAVAVVLSTAPKTLIRRRAPRP